MLEEKSSNTEESKRKKSGIMRRLRKEGKEREERTGAGKRSLTDRLTDGRRRKV